MEINDTLTGTVGSTPLVRLKKIQCGAELLAKIESCNPLGSVKDRVAVAMVDAGEKAGRVTADTTIIEPTSGNTGIGLAFVCACRGYRLLLTMPETMSLERRKLLVHLGAELVLTPGSEGMKGAINRAESMVQDIPGSWMPDQFTNPANPQIHRQTTGPEILEQTGGKLDFFVAGVGTGGTMTGVAGYLKEKTTLKAIAVEPADSPVLSGGEPGPHKIQGIGGGFVPDNLNTALVDEVVQVENDAAFVMARTLASREGILCGISSGAAVSAAVEIGNRQENKGKRIVVILPDTGERYLSTALIKDLD
jgi:cysteine synthase A